uniref:Immunoglobulin domain-containing protein n=1 Tax=Seriola dumerili TaxID=41447 RepID=A0A3B4V8S9_SERDU
MTCPDISGGLGQVCLLHIFIQWPLIYLSLSDGALLYANLGDNVILPCFYSSSAKNLCWYKQVAGEQPQIISSFYKHSFYNIFYNQFKDDKRFSVHTGAGFYHLNISNVQDSDSAIFRFLSSHFLHLICRSFLQQPLSESVQAGGSVSLNGTVHTGTSDGEHSVYWFRKDTGKSHLGILYVHTHSSSRCVKAAGSESPAQSRCVYNLWRRSVSLSDAGTYYCAVASCGEILFGEGTRLEVEGEQNIISTCSPSFHVMCFLHRLSSSLHVNRTERHLWPSKLSVRPRLCVLSSCVQFGSWPAGGSRPPTIEITSALHHDA